MDQISLPSPWWQQDTGGPAGQWGHPVEAAEAQAGAEPGRVEERDKGCKEEAPVKETQAERGEDRWDSRDRKKICIHTQAGMLKRVYLRGSSSPRNPKRN